MNLQEILTEEISAWEEGLIASLFLSGTSVDELSLNIKVQAKVARALAVLNELPWSYAKEVCYSVVRVEA